jgi:hypothetical protein
MRFTQFGHQVPRKNSKMTGPCSRKLGSENFPPRFAAASEKSGARDPIPSVSVQLRISKSTLRYSRDQNKSRRDEGTTGGTGLLCRAVIRPPMNWDERVIYKRGAPALWPLVFLYLQLVRRFHCDVSCPFFPVFPERLAMISAMIFSEPQAAFDAVATNQITHCATGHFRLRFASSDDGNCGQ